MTKWKSYAWTHWEYKESNWLKSFLVCFWDIITFRFRYRMGRVSGRSVIFRDELPEEK